MKRELIGVVCLVSVGAVFAGRGIYHKLAQGPNETRANQTDARGATVWPNGWRITAEGKFVELPGDMPTTIIPLPDGRRALVNTCGYHDHSVSLVDIESQKILDKVIVPRLWIGMSFDPATNEVLVSGGSGRNLDKKPKKRRVVSAEVNIEPDALLRFRLEGDKLVPAKGANIPDLDDDDRFVSGIVRDGGDLLVANIQTDTLYRLSGDASKKLGEVKLGYRPYGIAVSPDKGTIAVSNWGDANVSIVDRSTFTEKTKVSVGLHPNALMYLPDGRLIVANAGSDTLSVIEGDRVTETIRTSILSNEPIGAAPIALTYLEAKKQLFVANSDNNSVAVVDMKSKGRSRVVGFIPTGRYASAVALTIDGKRLLVGSAKGLTSSMNGGSDVISKITVENGEPRVPNVYVGNILAGHLAIVDIPDGKVLAKYSKEVVQNRPNGKQRLKSVDSPGLLGALKTIKHIVYVIKENRTYDQVLGDDPRGNGDKNLVMFGADVTPNEHKIADQFVLFDNLYCDGEVSQVGHQWTDAGYAGDYTEKQWTLSYGGHEEVESDTRLSSSPGGYIWQDVKRHGLTARIYGEYLEWQEDHNSAHGAVKADPEKFGCSAAFEKVFARGGRDTEKVDVFLSEMKDAEKTGKWPNFMVMALNEDHTRGMSAGAFTPQAMVGSNDLAVGKLIDGVSHSKFWDSTAVFIIEDDAQDGADHVDCHRTTGYLACPLVKRGTVDHTMYSTSSMLRTIGLMLGIPPLSQYDENAMPMLACLSATADPTPYTAVAPRFNLMKKCPPKTQLANRSAMLDFTDVDRADAQELNDILWQAIHPGKPTPAPVHGFLSESR